MTSPSAPILIVEDSLVQALLLQNTLQKNGYSVVVARHGVEALELIGQSRPSLIITDIQMPEMDGYELCHRIKSAAHLHDIPVMLLTSLSSPQDIIRGLESGADNFVVKPFEEKFLIARIHDIEANNRLFSRDSVIHGTPIYFDGKEYVITSDRRQILNLLLSTYEAAIQTNTELKQAHERLKAAQVQLIEAEKLQSVGRLASGIAHEIRNPLSIIEMAVELLADRPQEEDKPVLEEIREAVRRANLVIGGLIDLSSPREMGMNVVNVRDCLENALTQFATQLSSAQIRPLRDYDAAQCAVRVDPAKIEQVFTNLLTNARDAMPDGGNLFLKTRRTILQEDDALFLDGDRSGQRLRAGDLVAVIQVEDTGPGLPPESLGRAFDPFFSTKPTGKGIGLGLTVARKIVELHGGRITIRNRPEGGAQVRVLLKISTEDKPL